LSGLLLLGTAGCSGNDENVSFNVADLASDLRDSLTFQDNIAEIEPEMACTLYGIKESDVEDTVVYISGGATAEEIAVVKAADKDAAKAVQNALEDRVKAQEKSYKDYNPGELDKLGKAVLSKAGNYVVLCISSDSDAAKKIISEYIK